MISIHTGPEFIMHYKLAGLLNVTYVTMLYGFGLPLLFPIALLSFFIFWAVERYMLAFFLVGAYQEILGDMHNLFGDTNVIHVDIGPNRKPILPHVIRGDRVQELLSYVEYHEQDLIATMRSNIEEALDAGRMTFEQSALLQEHYERGLSGYSYLTPNQTSL